MRSSPPRVFSDHLSYAQCWEDPHVLQSALQVGPEDDVLSICSAGDNAFALAIAGARSVTCLDISLPQLHLAELKRAAFSHLPPGGVQTVLGFNRAGRRVHLYHQLREHLSEAARSYWDANESLVRTGIASGGRFEKYLAFFREKFLPLVHRTRTVNALLGMSDCDAQQKFYEKTWNNVRWRGVFRLFFSRAVMARSGRSKEHFRYVDGAVSALFLRRAEHVLTQIPVATNPFVQWILSGAYPDAETTHPYLTTAGHAALTGAEDRIHFVHAGLEAFLERCEPGRFSAFNYSNLFEYLSAEQHERILRLTVRAARPGARIAYWNLLVHRHRPDSMASVLSRDPERAQQLLRKDRAFVYGDFHIETVT